MIYVSSTCSKQKKIGDAVLELAKLGFQRIELSGGTEYYDGYEDDLFEQKEKFKLEYLVHNYFPPPKDHFVLNLGSLNDRIFEKSFLHFCESVRLTKILGAKKYGFHAGFYTDIKVNELGNRISSPIIIDREKALLRFCHGFKLLERESHGISLYVENNMYSEENFILFGIPCPFMLVSPLEISELQKHINYRLLLDLGHLHVSSFSLGFDFESSLDLLSKQTDYIHISSNNGCFDQHNGLDPNDGILKSIKRTDLNNKTITLEIYNGLDKLRSSFIRISNMLEGQIYSRKNDERKD